MGRRVTVPIHVTIPYGQQGEITFYINDILYEGVTDINITMYLNNIWTFEGTVFGFDNTDTNIVTGNTVKIFSGNTHLMTGVLDKPEWSTEDEIHIKGICRVASKLKNARVGNNVENESFFTNKTSAYIIDRFASVNNDGSSPWIVNTNHLTTHPKLSVRADNDIKFNGIINTVKASNYDWYPSYGASPYDSTIINIEDEKGSSSPVLTINVSGNGQNAEVTSREENRDELWNDVIVCGYGDGINQIKSRCLSSSVNKTYLSADITSSATTATVDDGTKLAASGTCVIGCEKIPYTRSVNTLTLTRGSATFLDGTNVVESYAHNKGIAVYDYYAPTSPESSSSVDTYGHKTSPPQVDRSILDQNMLDFVAQTILAEHDTELVRIEVSIGDMYDILDTLVIGDYVTISDVAAGNNANFRVIGWNITDYELRLICSNTPRVISETIASTEDAEKNLNYYMQGSSNIISVQSYENAQYSATPEDNAMKMKFRIWDKTIAITDARLDFKILPFRAYTDTTPSGGGSTSGASSTSTTVSSDTAESTNETYTFYDVGSSTDTSVVDEFVSATIPSALSGTYNGCVVTISIFNKTNSNDNYDFQIINTTTATTLTSVSGETINDGSGSTKNYSYNSSQTSVGDTIKLNINDGILGTHSSKIREGYIYLRIQTKTTHNHNMDHTHSTPNHTHTMSYGIKEDSDTPTVKVAIGDDDDWAATKAYINGGSAYSYGTHNDIDIADALRTVVGDLSTTKRIRIQFEPQGAGNTCRIEANADLFVFLGSK